MAKTYDFSMMGYLKIQADKMHGDISDADYEKYITAYHDYLDKEYEKKLQNRG